MRWHRKWEGLPMLFTIFVTVSVTIASLGEIVPMILLKGDTPRIATVQPYTPLELAGRDIYISEGCNNCHSQMIRPFRSETERYGEYSKPGEFVYDHPFLWGSRRIGPDLARTGERIPSAFWHLRHLNQPTDTSKDSIMPPYPHLLEETIDFDAIERSMIAMRKLGVPYDDADIDGSPASAREQAEAIAAQIVAEDGPKGTEDRKVVALIAYLLRLGTDLNRPIDVEVEEITVAGADGAEEDVDA
jgi:cytochrome c oxidase cbb3-type subunit I/II